MPVEGRFRLRGESALILRTEVPTLKRCSPRFEEQNQRLAEIYEDIDTLLEATLSRDDYVDLNTLRVVVTHPPFDRTDLEGPTPEPAPIPNPLEPVLSLPEPPRGLSSLFGNRKHIEAVEDATRTHECARVEWKAQCRQAEARWQSAKSNHADVEEKRVAHLQRERPRFAKECEAREAEASSRNQELDELIANLGYGMADAVQEYSSRRLETYWNSRSIAKSTEYHQSVHYWPQEFRHPGPVFTK